MLTVSGRWAAGLRQNHKPVHRIQLWKTGTLLLDNLKVESGSVTKDASATPRVTANITMADTSPATAQLCTPFGYRLRFYRGLQYPDNTTELVLYADLDIIRSTFARPDNRLSMDLADPSAIIAGDTIPGPTSLKPASTQDAISKLLARSHYYGSRAVQDSTGADIPVAADWVADGDPWDAVEQLADGIGAECYFTPGRVPVLRPVPALKGSPDALLHALDGGTVEEIDSTLDRAPNVVYVWGAPAANGKQSRGMAYDAAATSPTAVSSAYGQVVTVIQRPTPLTPAQASSAALAMLRRVQGKVRTVTLRAVPDPSIEPGDTVEIRFAGGQKEKHIVQSVTVPIGGHDSMEVTTRTTAYTAGGWP